VFLAVWVVVHFTVEPAWAVGGKTAAQISLNINVHRLEMDEINPLLKNLLSGTYTKVPDESLNTRKKGSVSIQSPADKVQPIQAITTAGHLAFDDPFECPCGRRPSRCSHASYCKQSHSQVTLSKSRIHTAFGSPTGGKKKGMCLCQCFVWFTSAVRCMYELPQEEDQ